MSILNQMRKNPAITAGAFIFIIALIGWLVTRGSKGAAGPSGSGIKKGIKGTCSTLNPSRIDGHPSGVITWRCIDLSKP